MEKISSQVNGKYLLTDGNKIGILLLLHESKEIPSHRLLSVNNNYHIVKQAAVELRNTGLIKSTKVGTRVSWTLTDEGKVVADRLWSAETSFKRRVDCPKYYKE